MHEAKQRFVEPTLVAEAPLTTATKFMSLIFSEDPCATQSQGCPV